MSVEFDNIPFEMPKTQSNTIKVIGVGGGGSNAVNYMFQQQIRGVDFVICNTDAQALENSPIPNKIQLGVNLTSGLGAGANPEVGQKAAKESLEEIQKMLNTQTKMVFITAGMGGGTGTGAAPIIAKIAKDMGILTVGIVTLPFQFEGRRRSKQAQEGIDSLRNNVDSLIVINNNKLREVYGNLGFKAGFSKADEVLSTAAKGIAEVITHHYKQNIDLHDAKTVLSNSGTAIMGSAKEEGTGRAKNAIIKALDSPLLNDNRITGAKNVLLLIVSGVNEVTIDEIGEINDFIQEEAGHNANIIMGIGDDESLGDAISVTIVATGFAPDQQNSITNTEAKKIIHTLEDEQKATYDFSKQTIDKSLKQDTLLSDKEYGKTVYYLEEETEIDNNLANDIEDINNLEVTFDEILSENEISKEDFIITKITDKTNEEEIPSQQPQVDLLFDLPLTNTKESTIDNQIKLDLGDNVNEMNEKENRYVLEDFDIKPTIGKSSSIKSKSEIVEEDELKLQLKTVSPKKEIEKIEVESTEVSPLDLTVAELKKRTNERVLKMKKFNYSFKNQVNKNIEEIENQPAYKRFGVNLDEVNTSISKSKTVLKIDDNEIELKSTNSFLHDNVD